MRKGSVFVVSAPSGSGKTTICRKLLERVEDLELSVSYSTRPRKRGEADGVDYYFITPEVFDKMINSKVFLEHAFVHGNRYGTSRETVESIVSRGKDALLEIDVQGGRMVKETVPGAVLVAIFPPDREALERRLAVFLTLLEPVMILVMGGIVLMIVLAILLPIIEINQLVR